MGSENWLRLTDYASKYRISISTLRRRIKSGEITHRFEDGKYLILDGDGRAPEAPAQVRQAATPAPQVAPQAVAQFAAPQAQGPAGDAQEKLNQLRVSDEPILSSANRLLSELKRAYMNILQEKEEQMIQLKEEVSDLKTLVRVLEDDNDRMRHVLQSRS